jgi:hypothetical protein
MCVGYIVKSKGTLIMIVIYIVAAAVVICGCAYIMKTRSRD